MWWWEQRGVMLCVAFEEPVVAAAGRAFRLSRTGLVRRSQYHSSNRAKYHDDDNEELFTSKASKNWINKNWYVLPVLPIQFNSLISSISYHNAIPCVVWHANYCRMKSFAPVSDISPELSLDVDCMLLADRETAVALATPLIVNYTITVGKVPTQIS